MAFEYLDEEMINELIASLIRSKLEYVAVIWPPRKKKDIKKLERLQRTATKMASILRNLPYEERLSWLKLLTLEKKKRKGRLYSSV